MLRRLADLCWQQLMDEWLRGLDGGPHQSSDLHIGAALGHYWVEGTSHEFRTGPTISG